uniref:Uncharacterized protein n=1 Tax=Pristionchus pacificus TaxID=54126 RepID=A0A2A6CHD2_PRIPA
SFQCQDMRVRPRNSIPRPVTRPPIVHHIMRVTIPNWGADWRKGLTERRIAFGRK